MRALQGAENSLVAVPESRVVDAPSPPTPILLSNLQHHAGVGKSVTHKTRPPLHEHNNTST